MGWFCKKRLVPGPGLSLPRVLARPTAHVTWKIYTGKTDSNPIHQGPTKTSKLKKKWIACGVRSLIRFEFVFKCINIYYAVLNRVGNQSYAANFEFVWTVFDHFVYLLMFWWWFARPKKRPIVRKDADVSNFQLMNSIWSHFVKKTCQYKINYRWSRNLYFSSINVNNNMKVRVEFPIG